MIMMMLHICRSPRDAYYHHISYTSGRQIQSVGLSVLLLVTIVGIESDVFIVSFRETGDIFYIVFSLNKR